jgi:nucleoside-triphosphate--adenylate kinase
MLMFGKPGVGKGTLSARLVRKYEINTLSVGDLLRNHITQGTELGRLAQDIMEHGELLPDDFVLRIVETGLEPLKNEVRRALNFDK